MNDDDYEEYGDPAWATGRATGYLELGAMLPTKDGRRSGNACVVAVPKGHDKQPAGARVLTDAGNTMTLQLGELEELYHPPTFTMNPDTCPGMKHQPKEPK